jgi:hypothetical protein
MDEAYSTASTSPDASPTEQIEYLNYVPLLTPEKKGKGLFVEQCRLVLEACSPQFLNLYQLIHILFGIPPFGLKKSNRPSFTKSLKSQRLFNYHQRLKKEKFPRKHSSYLSH